MLLNTFSILVSEQSLMALNTETKYNLLFFDFRLTECQFTDQRMLVYNTHTMR